MCECVGVCASGLDSEKLGVSVSQSALFRHLCVCLCVHANLLIVEATDRGSLMTVYGKRRCVDLAGAPLRYRQRDCADRHRLERHLERPGTGVHRVPHDQTKHRSARRAHLVTQDADQKASGVKVQKPPVACQWGSCVSLCMCVCLRPRVVLSVHP